MACPLSTTLSTSSSDWTSHIKVNIDRFHRHATKKIGNRPVEEAWKMKYYKGLIFKQIVQISGLCGLQFLSYLPKRFTHLSRALYGDTILVHRFGAPIWRPEINKNISSSLVLYIRAHKHIF